MSETIIIQNIEQFKSVLMDKLILFFICFLLTLCSAYIKSVVLKKISLKEMVAMSIFFGILFSLSSDFLNEYIGGKMFLVAFLVGLIQKEVFYVLKKFALRKAEKFLGEVYEENDTEKKNDEEDKKE